MGKISNGWALTKTSFRVIEKNKKLMIFPLISGLVLVAVIISFILGLYGTGSLTGSTNVPAIVICFFAFYFIAYFVIIFFNVALIACATKAMDGEDVPLSYGISQAGSRIVQIVEWAILAATVGLILRMLEDRAGLAGQIALSLVGAAWSIATFFVVPIIVYEGLGPMASIKRSLGILRKSWGESFVGSISFGIIFVLLGLAGLIPLLLAFAIGGTAVGSSFWSSLLLIGYAL